MKKAVYNHALRSMEYIPLTPEEIAHVNKMRHIHAVEESSRPLSGAEILQKLIADRINTLPVDDNTALRMSEYYPKWESGVAYAIGHKVSYNGKLWRVLQAHTAQSGWEPENAASLWEQICRAYTGDKNDPIPYDGNMRLENCKFYIQNETIYKCIRDTINPVYHALSELVGHYVEEVTW